MENQQDLFTQIEQIVPEKKRQEQVRAEDFKVFLQEASQELAGADELGHLLIADMINEGVEEFDQNCEHMHRPVLVTGSVEVGYYDELAGRDARETRLISSQMMISHGFSVQPVETADGKVLQFGHLFLIPEATRRGEFSGLAERTTTYYAFAPYDTVIIDTEATDAQKIDFLAQAAPELMDEIDQSLLNAPTNLDALFGLRHLSVDPMYAQTNVSSVLASYVQKMVEVDSLPLLELSLQGLRHVDIGDQTIAVAFDKNAPDGGGITVLGRIQSLQLATYAKFAHDEVVTSEDFYWSATVSIEAASPEDEYYVGQVFGMSLIDIEAVPARPNFESDSEE